MGGIAEWLDALRYDHPGVYRLLLVMTSTSTLFVCFMLLPDVPMLRAMGISVLQQRFSASANGVYWSTRAAFNENGAGRHEQVFGNVEGVDQNGKLIVSIPRGDKWTQEILTLANAEITDLYGVAQIVGSLRMENARFDVYEQGAVVAWIRNTPLNVKLIEAGVAKPAERPPTNIFDLAFATYYWGLAKGRGN